MNNQEPIETRTPWSRRHCCQGAALGETCDWTCLAQSAPPVRQEPITLVDYERRMYEAMTKPGGGKVHPMSITTPTYEPNRAMAPEPESIIDKKGLKPRKEDTYAPVTIGDRVVVVVASSCAIAIIGILAYLFTKVG